MAEDPAVKEWGDEGEGIAKYGDGEVWADEVEQDDVERRPELEQ